jgi:hypothetical protein
VIRAANERPSLSSAVASARHRCRVGVDTAAPSRSSEDHLRARSTCGGDSVPPEQANVTASQSGSTRRRGRPSVVAPTPAVCIRRPPRGQANGRRTSRRLGAIPLARSDGPGVTRVVPIPAVRSPAAALADDMVLTAGEQAQGAWTARALARGSLELGVLRECMPLRNDDVATARSSARSAPSELSPRTIAATFEG